VTKALEDQNSIVHNQAVITFRNLGL